MVREWILKSDGNGLIRWVKERNRLLARSAQIPVRVTIVRFKSPEDRQVVGTFSSL